MIQSVNTAYEMDVLNNYELNVKLLFSRAIVPHLRKVDDYIALTNDIRILGFSNIARIRARSYALPELSKIYTIPNADFITDLSESNKPGYVWNVISLYNPSGKDKYFSVWASPDIHITKLSESEFCIHGGSLIILVKYKRIPIATPISINDVRYNTSDMPINTYRSAIDFSHIN